MWIRREFKESFIVQVADKSEKVASDERFVFGNGWEYNGDIEK